MFIEMSLNGTKRKQSTSAFATRLQQLRIQKSLSQDELARRTGIHKNQIGRYERGDSQPTAGKIKKLCDVLGVSKDYLFDGVVEGAARVNFEDADFIELFREITALPEKPKDAARLFLRAFVNQYKQGSMVDEFRAEAASSK
jgi:transcriptional regulator with XRE-family HTH domain